MSLQPTEDKDRHREPHVGPTQATAEPRAERTGTLTADEANEPMQTDSRSRSKAPPSVLEEHSVTRI